MKHQSIKTAFFITAIGILPVAFNACTQGFEVNPLIDSLSSENGPAGGSNGGGSGNGGPSDLTMSETTFNKTLYPLLVTNCSQCHGTVQHPKFAVEDVKSAHKVIIDRDLVSFGDPDSSYFIQKLSLGHNGFSGVLINEMRAKIQNWADQLNIAPVEPVPATDFKESNASAILNKTKMLVHGGALTEEEWQNYSGKTNDITRMRALVNSWMETPEGKAKTKFYLMTALNQDMVADSESGAVNGVGSNSGPGGALESNMRDSFALTALDIIDRNRPFTEIATTKRFAVTTGLLVSYAFMDSRAKVTPSYINFLRSNGISSDYTDWRFVNFEQSDETPISHLDITTLRSIKNNSTIKFGIPRVGYFTTPAFLGKYRSNDDNQFRVTINQTLIAGLSQTFSPSDTTHQPDLVHMDSAHVAPGTDCFQCHRLMDPMREVFGNHMNYNYKYKAGGSSVWSSFSFFGQIKPLKDFADLGSAIATHPSFHTAWTQKLCVALNTTKCLETDPEFIRISNLFKANGYNFKTLYAELLLSGLVTGSKATLTSSSAGFDVARTRKTHICQNMNIRQMQIQQKRNIAVSAYDEGKSLCKDNNAIDSIGDDYTIRGTTDVVNSFPTDAIARQGIERTCAIMAAKIIDAKKTLEHRNVNTLNESVELIVEFIAGLPKSHPRHENFKNALFTIHDYNTKTLSMSYTNSLKELFTFACVSPDFIGIGL